MVHKGRLVPAAPPVYDPRKATEGELLLGELQWPSPLQQSSEP